MTTADQLLEIKRRAEILRAERDKAQGALEQTMERLGAEFGCKTLGEAQTMLETLERKTARAKEKFETGFATFQKEFPELADGAGAADDE